MLVAEGVLRGLSRTGSPQTRLAVVEHQTISCPADLIKSDGSLDVYRDVRKLFEATFQGDQPAIRVRGWVGYIPLNDNVALEVNTRVPIGNLERMVSMASGFKNKVLDKYAKAFSGSETQPDSLLDLITTQLLNAFDHVWEYGLLKTYRRETRVGSSPTGRVMPYQSEWLTAKAGRPVAMSSAFLRTPDFGPNRVLRHAFEKLLVRYVNIKQDGHKARIRRLRTALDRLEEVRQPLVSDVTPRAFADFIRWMPAERSHNINALLLSQLIVFDLGVSIREKGGAAVLPSILIDMADVFEKCMRRVLAEGLRDDARIEVKDGNVGGADGAKCSLFDPLHLAVANPDVTPDIVVYVDGKPALVIDAKYKEPEKLPDRSDINQAILYGAKYAANRVMLLHASRPVGRATVDHCGNVGGFEVYNGMIDLNAVPIEAEEAAFVAAIRALYRGTDLRQRFAPVTPPV